MIMHLCYRQDNICISHYYLGTRYGWESLYREDAEHCGGIQVGQSGWETILKIAGYPRYNMDHDYFDRIDNVLTKMFGP